MGSTKEPDLVTDHADAFRLWLEREQALCGRTLSDIVSRARRVAKLVKIDSTIPDDEFMLVLARQDDFQSCTTTVRSQLRRAAALFRKFIKESRRGKYTA